MKTRLLGKRKQNASSEVKVNGEQEWEARRQRRSFKAPQAAGGAWLSIAGMMPRATAKLAPLTPLLAER